MERRRAPFGSRTFVVAASVVVAGLGSAGPAFASDLPGMPAVPTAPTQAPPEITIPALPPEPMEPPVVVAEIDAENIDVSISVLSPGEEEAPAAESTIPVVSPDFESDTTPPTDPSATDTGDDATEAPGGGVNTNVSVRVLSPGSSSGATQGSTGGGGDVAQAGAAPAEVGPDTAPAATTTPEATEDSEQYQGDNSQYQSDEKIVEDPWRWDWTLTIDCSGNPTSTSVESGKPESLEWAWEWAWEWGCSDAEAPASEPSSTTERSPPAAQPAAQPEPQTRAGPTSSSSSPASSTDTEPWNWTWTFTFCGKTETVTTQAGAGTPLTWTWDWAWNWSCGSAPAEGSAPASTTPPSTTPPSTTPGPTQPPSTTLPDPGAGTASLEAGPLPGTDSIQIPVLSFTVGPYKVDTGTAGEALDLPPAPSLPSEIVVEVTIPPAIPPSPAAPAVPLQDPPFPPGAAPLELGPHAVPLRSGLVQAPSTASAFAPPATRPTLLPRTATAAGGADAARETRPEKKQRAHVVRARPDSRPPLPLAPRSRHGVGSTSASGAASSALLVGIVALPGFVLLAAPGPGRRVEVARELSPRGLDRSPIDHPG